ncbi:hypothetical protein TNCV_791171 [Trichonephila clavipes]|nr:hypothetical protein TNCV_791171 [Trichonephila clavipes]
MQTVLISGVPKILCRVPSMARVPLVRHPWSIPLSCKEERGAMVTQRLWSRTCDRHVVSPYASENPQCRGTDACSICSSVDVVW